MGKNYKNFGKVTMIGFGIMFLYSAFNSTSNVTTQIFADDGYGQLGFIQLAVLYMSMGIGSLMSTAVINKLGTRLCLLMGGIGTLLQILSTLLPVE